MATYLERYLAGEREAVWEELTAFGAAIREEPLFADAQAVARETMRRVQHTIELLIPRLRTLGYRFGKAPRIANQVVVMDPVRLDEFLDDYLAEYPVFQPPPPDTVRTLDTLEQRAGMLPLSLRAFYLEIGGVNFTGMHLWAPRVLDYDPLFIFPVAELLKDMGAWSLDDDEDPTEAEQGEESARAEPGEARATDLWLSPDAPHKFNVSGGSVYHEGAQRQHRWGVPR